MKKIVAIVLVLATLLFTLAACGGNEEPEKELLGIVTKYVGEPIEVLDVNHEFSADDFTLWVIYAGEGGQEVSQDFTFEVVEYTDFYYRLEFTCMGYTDSGYVWIGAEEETAE